MSHQVYTPSSGQGPRPKPVRLFALGFGVAVGLVGLVAFAFLMPVEWGEAKLRFKLWKAGARPVLWEKHRGFTQDRCAGNDPARCPCVWMIHGMGDSVVTWRKIFLDPVAFGEAPARLYAIDLPGHGGSIRRREPKEYRSSSMARELDAEISKTATCTKNVLVGNSFGGGVAARMALENPKRYARLILVSPGGIASADAATRDLFKESTVESLKEFQSRAYFRPRVLSEAEWKGAVARMKSGSVAEIRGAQVEEDALDGSLSRIKVPTTLVWGEADRIIPRAVIDAYAKGIPRSEVVVLPECGHLPQKECPEKLSRVIRLAISL